MKDGSIVLAVLGLGAAVGGLMWWGHSRSNASGARPENVGPFPGLKLGTVVLVDTVKAQLLFVPDPTALAVVDLVMTDPELVSVRLLTPPGVSFSGTISRSAILKIVSLPPPGLSEV